MILVTKEARSVKEEERRRGDEERYGYNERERERERQRGRERYNDRDRDRGHSGRLHRSHRRSASPPLRASRLRSPSGSVPRSPTEQDKAKPNFAPSGLLAAETNTVKAADGTKTVLKYNEPPEARKPVLGWRLYVFKDSEQVELLHIHRQSAYLIGRDYLVADIPMDHPSCSKQHAVIQYRYIRERNEFGDTKGVIKPFIIDLESTNGTHVNGEQIPAARYYELRASDVIKFGLSTKEYVLLHDDAS
ncbi:SMAD/FHA domain-containing protein [Cyathus striatus]|nr:SMAD/FHA domain-containing protein [Cyathus striatus]